MAPDQRREDQKEVSKIIIHNRSRVTDEAAVAKVWTVIKQGKPSKSRHGPCSCFCTTFKDDIVVYVAKRSRDSETFYVDNL